MIDTTKFTAHKNPGKFEGETSATEYFWELVMNGDGETWSPDMDEDGEGTFFDLFTVDADEAETWPNEFKIGDTVIIWECPQGFVTLCAYGTRAAAEWHVNSWLGVKDIDMTRSEIRDERNKIKARLEQNGSIFSEEGKCGQECLPCGLCDECIEAGVLDDVPGLAPVAH